jgi:hypothetical protein
MCNLTIELVRTHDKENEIFYRYEVDGAVVWFAQDKMSGNIYTVGITPPEKLKNIFEMYIREDSQNDSYYPMFIEIRVHETLALDDVDAYIEKLEYAKELCHAIMSIFQNNDNFPHWNLFAKNNKKIR